MPQESIEKALKEKRTRKTSNFRYIKKKNLSGYKEKAKNLYMSHKSEKHKTSRKIEKPLHESRIRNTKHIEKESFRGGEYIYNDYK